MTLTLGVSRSESEIALSQEWGAWLTWNEKDVSHPFKTMILTSVTMVGWADVPDSDRGDFRRRRAVDISSYTRFSGNWCHTSKLFLGSLRICPEGYIPNIVCLTWWRHQMETFSALLALCAGNSPDTGEFPHKGQWRGALMFSLIRAWTNSWENNGDVGDLRRHRAHYDVSVMEIRGWINTNIL